MNNYLDMFNNPDKFKRAELQCYRDIFNGSIKETFLIEMLGKIEKDPEYVQLFLANSKKYLAMSSIFVGRLSNTLSLCKMIIMTHYKNVVLLDDNERGKLQNSNDYKNKLVREVVKMFRLEMLTVDDLSYTSFESYYPLTYYVGALTNYCVGAVTDYYNKPNNNQQYNIFFNHLMLNKLFMKIKACIVLADLRAMDELTATFRSLVEMFMVYVALWDKDDEVINSYYKLNRLTDAFNRNEQIPNDILTIVKKNKITNKVNYLNYGWLLNLEEFKSLKPEHKKVSIQGLVNVVDVKCDSFMKDCGTALYSIYKSCNSQAHVTTLRLHFFHLELSIFQNISLMLNYICSIMTNHLYHFEYSYMDLNLIKEIDILFDESRNIFKNMSSNATLLDKTDDDFVARDKCVGKIKYQGY